MKPRTKLIITICVTLLLAAYAVAACLWANACARQQHCAGLQDGRVRVNDPLGIGFVQADSLTHELSAVLGDLTAQTVPEVKLAKIRDTIVGLDKIEDAEVVMLNNNKLRITVTPLQPVARVWPAKGHSYYINREGKTIRATARYHMDVPQICGNIAPGASPAALLPLLDYLKAHPDMHRTISMISAADSANIFLIPAFRGPVVNIGDASNIDVKLSHLQTFYKKIFPLKGAEFYDTISLKWDNQIVATRRKNKLPALDVEIIPELEDEGPDMNTLDLNIDNTTQTNG